jgi:hypothetical protein
MARITLRPREVDTAWRIKYKNAAYDIKAARQNNSGDTMQVYATVNRNAPVHTVVTFAILNSDGGYLLTSDGGKLLGVAA